jgi:hypothetical protein
LTFIRNFVISGFDENGKENEENRRYADMRREESSIGLCALSSFAVG